MTEKWIGAAFIISACGFLGFSIAAGQKREMKLLEALIGILQFCENQLEYRLQALPELMQTAAQQTDGTLRTVFLDLESSMAGQSYYDAEGCMEDVLRRTKNLPESIRGHLSFLGKNLGQFDIQGQLSGFALVKANCRRDLENLYFRQKERLRSFRTLGICTGVGIAILLI